MKSFKRNYKGTTASRKNVKSSNARRRRKRQELSSNKKRNKSEDVEMDEVLAQLERQRSKNKSRPVGQEKELPVSPPQARIGLYIYDTTQKKYFPSSYKDDHSRVKIETQIEESYKKKSIQNKNNNFLHSSSICISTHQRQRIIQDWSMRIMGQDSHVIPVAIPLTDSERYNWNCMLSPIHIPFHLQQSHVNTETCIR